MITALAAGLMSGCPSPEPLAGDEVRPLQPDSVTSEENFSPAIAPGTRIRLLHDNPQYQTRSESEQTVTGVLTRVPVRTGPNTRELPIRLRTQHGDWGVYSEGLPAELLDALLNTQLEISAKWIDQSEEGFPTEVWIGSVALSE